MHYTIHMRVWSGNGLSSGPRGSTSGLMGGVSCNTFFKEVRVATAENTLKDGGRVQIRALRLGTSKHIQLTY